MKPLTKDIAVTLTIKFLLLITLWIVCFKSDHKTTKPAEQWLFGSDISSTKNNSDH